MAGPGRSLALMHRILGNRTVGRILTDLEHRQQQGGRSLSPLRITEGGVAESMLGESNAVAAARGTHIVVRKGALRGDRGRHILAHEVAHVLQQAGPTSHGGTRAGAETKADSFAQSVTAGGWADAGTSAAPVAWAYANPKFKKTDRVTKAEIRGKMARFHMAGAGGTFVLRYSVKHNLPPRTEPYTLRDGGVTIIGLTREYGFTLGRLDKRDRLLFKTQVPDGTKLYVLTPGTPFSTGGAGTARPTPSGKTGAPTPAPAKLPDAKPVDPTAKVPTVKITELKQIEILKSRGLIPVETADEIKAKLEKGEVLEFEEALALVEGLNKLIVSTPSKESMGARESWLKWARFVEKHKEKLSGKSRVSEKGMTVEEVKKILAEHKRYVGVKYPPPKTSREVRYDPALAESWNSLSKDERDLWNAYISKYGATADVSDSTRKDLSVTDAVKMNMAIRISPKYMSGGARAAAEALFNDPVFIGGTIAGITVYLALWLAPEPVFTKAASVLITIGLLSLISFSVSEIVNLARAWMALSSESASAKTLPEIEAAAAKFGRSIGGSGLRILVALATIIAGKALPAPKPLGPPPPGGGMAAATTGGGVRIIARPVTPTRIIVKPDGTIVFGGPGTGLYAASIKSGGGGKGGGGTTGGRKTTAKRKTRKRKGREKAPPKPRPERELPPRKPGKEEVTRGPRSTSEAIDDLESTVAGTKTSDPSSKYVAEAGTQMEGPMIRIWSAELGKTHTVYARKSFPLWLRKIFRGNRKPDMVAIDHGKKQIIVGDVTASPHSRVERPFARQETRPHMDKTIDYARQLIRNLPAKLKGYRVFAQERYWEHGYKPSRKIPVSPE